jgi:hypothetical protein
MDLGVERVALDLEIHDRTDPLADRSLVVRTGRPNDADDRDDGDDGDDAVNYG